MGDSNYLAVYKKIFGLETEKSDYSMALRWHNHETTVKKYFKIDPMIC
jgi:hypothetical protein